MSPLSAKDQEERRRQQRAHLLVCAKRCFAFKGPAGTRIADIAREAGVSQGLLHHYFESKEQVFVEIIRELMEMAVHVPALAAQQPGPPIERLRWYLELTLGGMLAQPEVVLLAMHAKTAAAPKETRALLMEQGLRGLQAVVGLVRDAQQAGEVVDLPAEVLASSLLAHVQGLALVAIEGGLPGPDDLAALQALSERSPSELASPSTPSSAAQPGATQARPPTDVSAYIALVMRSVERVPPKEMP